MPRKGGSRNRHRAGKGSARKLTLELLEDRRLLAADFNLLKDINALGSGSNPRDFTEVGSLVFFTANDGVNGYELWKTDGTEAGTVLVKDIRTGFKNGSYPNYLTNVGGSLYFAAYNDVSGHELWKSDGTEVGTVLVKDTRWPFVLRTPILVRSLRNPWQRHLRTSIGATPGPIRDSHCAKCGTPRGFAMGVESAAIPASPRPSQTQGVPPKLNK
jgi:ELWxxDGT repeat protein